MPIHSKGEAEMMKTGKWNYAKSMKVVDNNGI